MTNKVEIQEMTDKVYVVTSFDDDGDDMVLTASTNYNTAAKIMADYQNKGNRLAFLDIFINGVDVGETSYVVHGTNKIGE